MVTAIADWSLDRMAQLFIQGSEGSGNFGHKGRPGLVGGSFPRGLNPEGSKVEKYHNNVYDEGIWGNSHSQSSYISGESAETMGIEGYKVEEDERLAGNRKIYKRVSNKFLQAISDDEVGSEEMLYHGFQNTRNIDFQPGDTFKIPLTAISGGMDSSMSYGLRLDRKNQAGEPTVFVFPHGTSIASYSKWNNEDAKDFGYKYSEALVAGEFRVLKSSRIEMYMPQHDSRPGESWHRNTIFNVVELEPISVFDMTTKTWRK
ncbi:MAG: hypothetical protein ABIO63_09265 [Casimicrobiaceae bacterium]